MLIDGVEVWSAAARCWGTAGEGWELGPNDFPNPYQGQADNQVRRATNTERPSHCRLTLPGKDVRWLSSTPPPPLPARCVCPRAWLWSTAPGPW